MRGAGCTGSHHYLDEIVTIYFNLIIVYNDNKINNEKLIAQSMKDVNKAVIGSNSWKAGNYDGTFHKIKQ